MITVGSGELDDKQILSNKAVILSINSMESTYAVFYHAHDHRNNSKVQLFN